MPSTASGIVYPASTDDVRPWEDLQALADSVEALYAGLGVWQAFTPTLVSTSGLAVGTGADSEGRWCRIGKTVHWQFKHVFGTGATFGTGDMRVTLPIACRPLTSASLLQDTLGSWLFRDTSALEHYAGSIGNYASAGGEGSFAGAWTGTKPSTRIFQGQPFVVASGDVLTGGGIYETGA